MSNEKKNSMDSSDRGYFEYDDKFAPLCVRDVRIVQSDAIVDAQITQYLQESYKEGIKHSNAILPSGMSAGEAGVMYLRKMNNKRRKVEKVDLDTDQIIANIGESLKRHMDIDILADEKYRSAFMKHITSDLFQTKQYRRKIIQVIKLFLKEMNLKTKGYTSKLRNVMTTINTRLNLVESDDE
jgi:hypothetical protein